MIFEKRDLMKDLRFWIFSLLIIILVYVLFFIPMNAVGKIKPMMSMGEETTIAGDPDKFELGPVNSGALFHYYYRPDNIFEYLLRIKHLYKISLIGNDGVYFVGSCEREN